MSTPIVLRADRWVDIDAGEVRSPAVIVVDGDRIAAVNPTELPTTADKLDLGDVTLLPGLMDMELNMLMGGPHGGNKRSDVQDDPPFRTLRGIVADKTTSPKWLRTSAATCSARRVRASYMVSRIVETYS